MYFGAHGEPWEGKGARLAIVSTRLGEGGGRALPAGRRQRLSEGCQVSGGRTLVCETLLWQFCFVFIRTMMM